MKPIKDFETYFVDRDGTIINTLTGHTKIPTDNRSGRGYLYVDLYNAGKKKRAFVHRLVAETYIPNPYNKSIVNHKDGNTKNNNVSNLEWCTAKENVTHAANVLQVMRQYRLANEKRKKRVACYDHKSGNYIMQFDSIKDASRFFGIPTSNIVNNLKGRQTHTRGLRWCYVEEIE